jgi:diguanylate cyclase (GGDEF)-like protein/PAS domain S-box-containing protein
MLNLLYLVFTPPESSLLYEGNYDPLLVCLSVFVAVVASYAALMVSHHAMTLRQEKVKRLWFVGGGLCLGMGIWAMHFVGMLAFSLPCSSNYDPVGTFLSMIPSILASALAIKIISQKEISNSQLAIGGLLLGVGIGAMHYAGMAAMHLNGFIRYNFNLFLLSLFVAVALATFALWIKFRLLSNQIRPNHSGTIISAIIIGFAASGMHYTAMASAYFIRDGDITIDSSGITPTYLALIVLAATLLIVVLTIVLTFIGKTNFVSFSRSYKLIGFLVFGWGVLAWLSADYYYGHLAVETYQRELRLANQQATDVAGNIDKNIELLKGISVVVSRDEDVHRVLRRFGTNATPSRLALEVRKNKWTHDAELSALNQSLQISAENLGADLIYVINAAGDCVASSNAENWGTTVGTNYAERIYFAQIRSGHPGHQYAMGHTTSSPGLYYVYPVIEKGRFLGGAVVKRDISKLVYWTNQANAFISDSNGVIVLASSKRLQFHSLPNSPIANLPADKILDQYSRTAFEPLQLTPWSDSRFSDAVRIADDELPTVLASKSFPEDSITVHVPRQLEQFEHLKIERVMLFLLLATTGSLLIITASATMLFLRESQKADADLRVAATAFESQEGMLITDANQVILRVNQAVSTITGYAVEELLGKHPNIFQSGRHDVNFYSAMWESIKNTGVWEGELWNRRKNGEVYPEYMTITAVKNQEGIVVNYVSTFSDKTTSKAAAEEIKNLAFFDPLTQLPNRRLMIDRLQQALASNIRTNREGALLFIDLDNFKVLNDTLGHDVGDMLLKQVALRLKSCVREGDTVARFGGDEFVVMLEDLSEQTLEAAEQTEAVGQKILATLNETYQLERAEHHSTPSIGATLFGGQKHSIDELLKQADIAMYQAKKAGRNTMCFFDPQMQSIINAHAAMEGELRLALEKKQFHLYYQIQVDSFRRPIGAEALIRWIHPERGAVSPAQFIPLAEETGLIVPIGQWVLETACAQLAAWQHDEATRGLVLAVNVSAKQFRQPDFVKQVREAVQHYSIRPSLLKLELTESMLLENIEGIIATMNGLKEIDVRISLDDFGTGYSSLQYLKRLPISQLKIDQSFVRDIAVDSSDKAIVSTIIAMSKSLNLDVIAEGVETEEQWQFLINAGCELHQGYLFGKPLPIEGFAESLRGS